MEYKVEIGGITYGMGDIESVNIEQPLFDKLSVGNACSAKLTIVFWEITTIPKMSKIVPYARKQSTDDWIMQGEFYIDTRSLSDGKMTIVAYDAMLKGEIVWVPSQHLVFPMSMENAVAEIASLMGVEIDNRTLLNSIYTIDYPANDYTMRDILRYIAAAHAGNWIMTIEGRLLLVPLFASMPPETHYLVTEYGNPITFGGTRILV